MVWLKFQSIACTLPNWFNTLKGALLDLKSQIWTPDYSLSKATAIYVGILVFHARLISLPVSSYLPSLKVNILFFNFKSTISISPLS